jgi:hypothetical protein
VATGDEREVLGERGREREVARRDHAAPGLTGGLVDLPEVGGGQSGRAHDDRDAPPQGLERVGLHRVRRRVVDEHVAHRGGDGQPHGVEPQRKPAVLAGRAARHRARETRVW